MERVWGKWAESVERVWKLCGESVERVCGDIVEIVVIACVYMLWGDCVDSVCRLRRNVWWSVWIVGRGCG